MRIYEGSPRQDYEEVLRSIGTYLDQRGMRDILLLEAPDGFIVQGLVVVGATSGTWSDSMGQIDKETLTFLDEDIARFMDEAVARRGSGPAAPGTYEHALRVIGRYVDEQRPRDIFLLEQDGAFVVRLHRGGQATAHHTLAEFTKDDIGSLVGEGPALRRSTAQAAQPDAAAAT